MGDDDRNTWLDQRAAEQLLAGEELDAGAALPPADRDTAERLAALLETAARAGRPALDTELPGERAALAAFRAAHAAEPADPAGSAGPAVPARNGHPLNGRAANGTRPNRESRVPARRVPAEPVVRLAPAAAGTTGVPPAPRRRRLRTAAAVTAAGCVLGGVALAAGTVLRTTPADPEPTTGPAVSPTATADPDRTGGDDANENAASAGGGRAEDRPEGKRDKPDTSTAPGGGADHGAAPDGREDEDAGQGGAGHVDEPGAKGKSVERLCEKFLAVRDGKEKVRDKKSWNRLVREAGGEDAIADFCAEHVGPGGKGGPGGPKADHDEGDEGDEGDEDD
ncbi:hypothetical protein [Streptomyces sp. 184]|uniref:hypothetical protein n=1 Tax=Streptomyces sp. 184 TaxID=1827526 RepID=UPI00389242D9